MIHGDMVNRILFILKSVETMLYSSIILYYFGIIVVRDYTIREVLSAKLIELIFDNTMQYEKQVYEWDLY